MLWDRLVETAAAAPRLVFVVLGALTLLLGIGIPRLTVATEPDAFVIVDSPEGRDYAQFQETFGSDDVNYFRIELDDPLNPENLALLEALHREVEKVPHVKTVQSIAADSFIGIFDIENPDHTDLIRNAPLVEGSLYSEEPGRAHLALFAGINLIDEDGNKLRAPEFKEHVDGLFAAIDAVETPEFQPQVASTLVVSAQNGELVSMWIGIGTGLLFVLIALLVGIAFGSWRAPVLPLAIVSLSLVWTLGIMGWAGLQLNAFSQVLIMLVLIAGVADGVHVLHRYATATEQFSSLEPRQAAIDAVQEKRPAIVFTSLTTAAGFGSFVFIDFEPLAQIGLFGAIGVLAAMLVTLVLSPTLLPRISGQHRPPTLTLVGTVVERVVTASYRHRIAVAAGTTAVVVLALIGVTRTQLGFDINSWVGQTETTRLLDRLAEVDGVGATLQVTVRPAGVDDVRNPDFARTLDEMQTFVQQQPYAGSTPNPQPSIIDIYRLLPAIAADPLVEQLGLVSEDGRTARLTFATNYPDDISIAGEVRDIEAGLENIVGPQADVTVTGIYPAVMQSATTALSTSVRSYALALALISLLMVVAVRRLGRGLVAMIPNVLPALALMGAMGFFGIAIDPITVVVGAIVIGISVDDTVHLIHDVYLRPMSSPTRLGHLQQAARNAGGAVCTTTLIVAAGFVTFLFFPVPALRTLGMLSAAALLMALLADLVVLPALVGLLDDVQQRKRNAQPT